MQIASLLKPCQRAMCRRLYGGESLLEDVAEHDSCYFLLVSQSDGMIGD